MKNKKIAVCGSIAFDYLSVFNGDFKHEFVVDKKMSLSVAFPIQDKRTFFGGCAGNIAYNARLLKEDVLTFGLVGRDFGMYKKWLTKNKISCSDVLRDDADITSEANIITDKKGQQLAVFYPGAAARSHLHKSAIQSFFKKNSKKVAFAIISPNDGFFMKTCITSCRQNKIHYFFDPGQAMSLFSPTELEQAISHSCGVFVNEYEDALLQKNLGKNLAWLCANTPLYIVTQGAQGSMIYWNGRAINIRPQKPKRVADPTGCGDAYRAGFLSTIKLFFPELTEKIIAQAGVNATKLATRCCASLGTQCH